MEPHKSGLRDRFRDWRHRRSRSRDSSINETQPENSIDAPTSTLQESSLTSSEEVNTPPSQQAQEPSQSSLTGAEPTHSQLSCTSGIPALVVTPPDLKLETTPPRSVAIEDQSSKLWKDAYNELRQENEQLIENYEVLLKDQANIPQNANLQDNLLTVAKTQRNKAANQQWKFQWFGKQQNVRDVIERTLNITNEASSLISIGVQFAPPFVSVPWSAVTALIPFMMNDINEHKGCVDGLEIVAKLIFSYQMAERAFLNREQSRDLYRRSVVQLYKKILEYQALAIQYFGKSTLRRFGKNVLGSREWAEMPSTLSLLDSDTRRSLQFLGQESQMESLMAIDELLRQQSHTMSALIQKIAAERDQVSQVVDWVSPISVERDHQDVRQKLGLDHFSSGRWYLEAREVSEWRTWAPSCQCIWLRDGIGTGKSSLSSILIENLVGDPDGVIAFFYCSRKADKDSTSPSSTWTISS